MLIGLTGKAGSGKDTVAGMLQKINPNLEVYALASSIYEIAERWLGLTEAYAHRDIKESTIAIVIDDTFNSLDLIIWDMFKDKHCDITYESVKKCAKAIITTLTKDSVTQIADNHYLVTSFRKILQTIGTEGFRDNVSETFWLDIAPSTNIIISDIRFPNEASWVKAFHGYLINVHRQDMEFIPESEHSSESGVGDVEFWDFIDNDGSLEDLKLEVKETYNVILEDFDAKN